MRFVPIVCCDTAMEISFAVDFDGPTVVTSKASLCCVRHATASTEGRSWRSQPEMQIIGTTLLFRIKVIGMVLK